MTPNLVWVTGAHGLIGSYLLQNIPHALPCSRVVGLTRDRLDLLDHAAIRAAFAAGKPDLVIHSAALSRSQACETDPSLAQRLNIDATRLLSELASDVGFVFFSTDLVLDGRTGNYDESATVNPLSRYAETKAVAESLVLRNPAHFVIRTSLNGGTSPTRDRGFNEEMRRAWKAGRTLTLFTDEFRCPIAAETTARATWELARKAPPGLYHVAGSERLSRWEIGKLVAARWPELQPRIQPGSLRDYSGPPRSPDTSLNCAKAQARLSFRLPGLSDWLAANPDEEF